MSPIIRASPRYMQPRFMAHIVLNDIFASEWCGVVAAQIYHFCFFLRWSLIDVHALNRSSQSGPGGAADHPARPPSVIPLPGSILATTKGVQVRSAPLCAISIGSLPPMPHFRQYLLKPLGPHGSTTTFLSDGHRTDMHTQLRHRSPNRHSTTAPPSHISLCSVVITSTHAQRSTPTRTQLCDRNKPMLGYMKPFADAVTILTPSHVIVSPTHLQTPHLRLPHPLPPPTTTTHTKHTNTTPPPTPATTIKSTIITT